MAKLILAFIIILNVNSVFAQKDEMVKKMPVLNGKLLYADSVNAEGHDRVHLDSVAKKWFYKYFMYSDTMVNHTTDHKNDVIFKRGVYKFRCTPGYVNILFYGILTMQIKCNNNYYTYKISDIYFRPANGILSATGFERDPSYLIGLYNKKHLSFGELMRIDKRGIRNYLYSVDTIVRACISSLNKAMVIN